METVLQEHPAALESGVAQVLDAQKNDIVKAWVVLHEGYNPSPELAKELQDYVKKRLLPISIQEKLNLKMNYLRLTTGKSCIGN